MVLFIWVSLMIDSLVVKSQNCGYNICKYLWEWYCTRTLIDDVKQNVASDWSQILCTGILQALIFGGMGAGCTRGRAENANKNIEKGYICLDETSNVLFDSHWFEFKFICLNITLPLGKAVNAASMWVQQMFTKLIFRNAIRKQLSRQIWIKSWVPKHAYY